eukprot:COSAG01_NODE_495_length_16308_cov_92.317088_21_plen_55_part_00
MQMIMTSRASMTVPTPTVSEDFGTCEMSPSKNREFAWIVSSFKYLMRGQHSNGH